ncbi:MAG: Crp/Fnr family transcriptional regulator [Dethiobacter sp.]|nr:Crp/Fnr family transcriptional regulator [Dethiobacter sp.]MBS3902367.1 Crp/Fnr family transcriptional regulator [Dethiobacter sp.]MBS4008206.1 Crp/Fnr family transcriptional regulator [Clostridium sp.]
MPTRMKLTSVNLIETLESADYQEFYTIFMEKRHHRRELISSPLQEENLVFLVKTGRVRVFLAYEDKEFTLSVLERGDIFSTHTRAFAQALDEETVVLTAQTEKFGEMIARYPQFYLIIVRVLGDLLKNSITIINGLVFKETHSRLAQFLVQAAKDKGELRDGEVLLKLGLNVEELSTILGASRQTISQILNDFYRAGILQKIGRHTIIIKDLHALKQVNKD